MDCELLIVGGGPAGLSAALYAARGGLKTLLLEKAAIGGQAVMTADIENYPAVKAASGIELAMTMREQAEAFGAVIEDGNVTHIDFENKTVTTDDGVVRSARALIIASGANARPLGVSNEQSLLGRGVSYCATCDGGFFRGKDVVVVGGGNTAVEDALYLAKLCHKVYLVHRRNELRASAVLSDRVKASEVEILWDSVVTELHAEKRLTGVTVQNVKTGESGELAVSGIFVAVGQAPQNDLFKKDMLDEQGYVVTDDAMQTAYEGVFAAGDIRKKTLRQVVTAAADGAIAADSAVKYLSLEKKPKA